MINDAKGLHSTIAAASVNYQWRKNEERREERSSGIIIINYWSHTQSLESFKAAAAEAEKWGIELREFEDVRAKEEKRGGVVTLLADQ